jgi:hypothetical protein
MIQKGDSGLAPRDLELSRRTVLKRVLALGAGLSLPGWMVEALAQAEAAATAGGVPVKRRALVLGNSTYRPERQSIPSSRKNARDVADALTKLGFEVRSEVDLASQPMRALVQEFFAQLRADSASRVLGLFYFSGHGIQYRLPEDKQTQNYIVPGDVALDQNVSGIAKASINIDRELIGQASLPNDGSVVLIFDACRNEPGKDPKDRSGSFNQVNPPPGTVITYSTAPGRYAIAPKSEHENSIYTRFLVQELQKANADITIKDFLDQVKFEVKRYMEGHQEEFLRRHAQDPEVAANLRLRMSFALERVAPPVIDDSEQKAWAAIERTIVPAERVKLLQDFIATYKTSRFLQAAQVQLERASITEAATQRNRVQIDTAIGDQQFRADQQKALDGDKDAAFRVAGMFRDGSQGVPRDERRMVQWLRHASELKNGIASWELYLYYRDRQILREEVRYLKLATDQGYTPPPTISNIRG